MCNKKHTLVKPFSSDLKIKSWLMTIMKKKIKECVLIQKHTDTHIIWNKRKYCVFLINKIHKCKEVVSILSIYIRIYLLKYSFQFQERCFYRNNVLKHVLIGITINSKTPFIPRVKIWWLDLKWNIRNIDYIYILIIHRQWN